MDAKDCTELIEWLYLNNGIHNSGKSWREALVKKIKGMVEGEVVHCLCGTGSTKPCPLKT